MTGAKRKKLQEIRDRLFDVYLGEADPDNWTDEAKAKEKAKALVADGLKPSEAAKIVAGWKGERYWEKKNANQTMALLLNIERYLEARNIPAGSDVPEDVDDEIDKLEKKAKAALARTRPKLVKGGKG